MSQKALRRMQKNQDAVGAALCRSRLADIMQATTHFLQICSHLGNYHPWSLICVGSRIHWQDEGELDAAIRMFSEAASMMGIVNDAQIQSLVAVHGKSKTTAVAVEILFGLGKACFIARRFPDAISSLQQCLKVWSDLHLGKLVYLPRRDCLLFIVIITSWLRLLCQDCWMCVG